MPCSNHPDVITDLSTCTRCGGQFCRDCVITLQGQTICAACKGEQVQDIKSGTVQGELELARRGARLGAVIIDGIVTALLWWPLLFVLAMNGKSGTPPGETWLMQTLMQNLVQIPIFLLYEALMLSWRGQTLGKMAMKIKVVMPDGSDIGAGNAWIRTGARVFMNATQILGMVDALFIFSRPRTCLHDRIAKTKVIVWKR